MYKASQECHRRLPFLHKFYYIYNVLHLQSVTGDYLSSLAASCSTCSLHPTQSYPLLSQPRLHKYSSFALISVKVCKTIGFSDKSVLS